MGGSSSPHTELRSLIMDVDGGDVGDVNDGGKEEKRSADGVPAGSDYCRPGGEWGDVALETEGESATEGPAEDIVADVSRRPRDALGCNSGSLTPVISSKSKRGGRGVGVPGGDIREWEGEFGRSG